VAYISERDPGRRTDKGDLGSNIIGYALNEDTRIALDETVGKTWLLWADVQLLERRIHVWIQDTGFFFWPKYCSYAC
jgi:hypothetical protein